MRITCWVIERADGSNRRFLTTYLGTSRGAGGHFFEWHDDFRRALKFTDYQSCKDTLSTIFELRRELFPTNGGFPKTVKFEAEREEGCLETSAQILIVGRIGPA